MNRAERVYSYMKEFGSITPMEAFQDLGYTRLACAINEMKRDGHKVRKQYETRKNRFGQQIECFCPFKQETKICFFQFTSPILSASHQSPIAVWFQCLISLLH